MKKLLFLLTAIGIGTSASAKKVKFSVDMDTITPNVNGIHITGDFQDEAGFPADWDPSTTQLIQEVSNPGIYSIIVDIPAFRKYEFKFVNGIFGYEVEFVPTESRVGYLFNDNRWIYIDSLANDTQAVAAVIYGTNAPAGKHLLRFKVDMRNTAPLDPKGIHVAGTFNTWNTAKHYMYTFDSNIHEYITYVDTGIPAFQHEFKYYNGNTSGNSEAVPLACANGNGNRHLTTSRDTVLVAVCYAQCSPCSGNGISSILSGTFRIFPNPCSGIFRIEGEVHTPVMLKVYDIFGRIVAEFSGHDPSQELNIHPNAGTYFLVMVSDDRTYTSKLVVE